MEMFSIQLTETMENIHLRYLIFLIFRIQFVVSCEYILFYNILVKCFFNKNVDIYFSAQAFIKYDTVKSNKLNVFREQIDQKV